MTTPVELFTIGVYGRDADAFFQQLTTHRIDLLCDLRRRRAVRGAHYAFANSRRLQARLAELGIAYVHLRELAPTPATSAHQHAADQAQRIPKRQRQHLSPAYVAAYETTTLADFEAEAFLAALPPTVRRLALLCVEGAATACHRSLVAQRLAALTGGPVVDL